jgi:hypothetical protein
MKTAHADMNGKTATTPTKLSILILENASVPSKAAQLTIHGTLTNAHVLAIKSTNAQDRRIPLIWYGIENCANVFANHKEEQTRPHQLTKLSTLGTSRTVSLNALFQKMVLVELAVFLTSKLAAANANQKHAEQAKNFSICMKILLIP